MFIFNNYHYREKMENVLNKMPFDRTAIFVGRTMAMPKSPNLIIENKNINERFAYSPDLSGRRKIFNESDSKTNPLFDDTETLKGLNVDEKANEDDWLEKNFKIPSHILTGISLTTINSHTQNRIKKDFEEELFNDEDNAIINNDVPAMQVLEVDNNDVVRCFQDVKNTEESTKIAKVNNLKSLNLFSNTYFTEREITSKNRKLILIFWMLLLEVDLPNGFYESLQKSDTFMTYTSKFVTELEIMTLKAMIE